MSVADEIAKLHQLKESGALTDAEFAAAKARLLGDETPRSNAAGSAAINGLRRSRDDRWIGGVCGGIGRMTGVESWVWRLLWVLMACFAGVGVFAYVLCWIFVPDENAG
ncbi:PspC domain-containing protein [Niveibacterium sp. COAC-50]|uniref:PspC domain-containing protein n=1 Tax=Niveibacterium sp. COAC-50 TaxID=2729384 RepID=UPI00155600C3|nr:PspC domain-containing protein [Niveibacterium sp. COAC-50]